MHREGLAGFVTKFAVTYPPKPSVDRSRNLGQWSRVDYVAGCLDPAISGILTRWLRNLVAGSARETSATSRAFLLLGDKQVFTGVRQIGSIGLTIDKDDALAHRDGQRAKPFTGDQNPP